MQAGISTACLYPLDTEKSLKQIISLKPACVEVFINADQELRPSYLRNLRAMADDGGVKIVSVHPYLGVMEPMLFFSDYQRRFQQGMELYRRFYRAVNILGADTLVFHGDHKHGHLDKEQYFERFERIWNDARRYGVSLCQENVERCKSRDINFFAQMRKILPQAEYVLDIKQAVRAGQDIGSMAEVMAGKIKLVHMSDHTTEKCCMSPGKGNFDIGEFLWNIVENGFDKNVIVELYRENFIDIVELSGGFQLLSNIISTVS